MMARTLALLVAAATSIGLHGYLAMHYYPVRFGVSTGESVCNINSTFSCDAVAASPYASIGGVPLAMFGMIANSVFLLLLILQWIGLVENQARALRGCFYFSALIAFTSLIMGALSFTLMSVYCLFCIALYLLSFLQLGLTWSLLEENPLKTLSADLRFYFFSSSQSWKTFALLLLIPAISYLSHAQIISQYGAEDLAELVESASEQWLAGRQMDFSSVPPALSKGSDKESAKFTIVEFADFLCGHCKNAAPALANFAKGRSDVRIEFYPFPLDGSCNAAIENPGDQVRCYLAGAAWCAGQIEKQDPGQKGLGWLVHDGIFARQNQWRSSKQDDMNALFSEFVPKESFEKLKTCTFAPETLAEVRKNGELGKTVGVNGTPAIFVNNRRLNAGQYLPVLERVYSKVK